MNFKILTLKSSLLTCFSSKFITLSLVLENFSSSLSILRVFLGGTLSLLSTLIPLVLPPLPLQEPSGALPPLKPPLKPPLDSLNLPPP